MDFASERAAAVGGNPLATTGLRHPKKGIGGSDNDLYGRIAELSGTIQQKLTSSFVKRAYDDIDDPQPEGSVMSAY